jgi:hypothetical protein
MAQLWAFSSFKGLLKACDESKSLARFRFLDYDVTIVTSNYSYNLRSAQTK